jgi:hypothetical protein
MYYQCGNSAGDAGCSFPWPDTLLIKFMHPIPTYSRLSGPTQADTQALIAQTTLREGSVIESWPDEAVAQPLTSMRAGAAPATPFHPRWDDWFEKVLYMGGLNIVAGASGSARQASVDQVHPQMARRGEEVYVVTEDELDDFEGSTAFVLLVPELRSVAGVHNAVKLSQSGYTVVGSMHADSTQSAFNRLRSFGVSTGELEDCLSTVMAQRLCWGPLAADEGSQPSNLVVVSELASFECAADFERFRKAEGAWRPMQLELEDLIAQGLVHPGEADGTLVKNPVMKTITLAEALADLMAA